MFDSNTVYYTFDQPVPYKGLLFYPVKMRDYFIFSVTLSSLMLEKTSDPDPLKTIPMTYLQYLFYKNNSENKLIFMLDGLLRICLRKIESKNFEIKYAQNRDSGKPEIIISGKAYTSNDFDKIRELIAKQNGISLPNERIQKNVRDAMEQARKYKQKISGNKIADLEDQMIALSVYTGLPIDTIYEMTVRKFKRYIERADHMMRQEAYLSAEMSGMVTFKDKNTIKSWLADIEKEEEYADVSMDLDSLKSKVDFSEAKK